jgi:hypothetical protein
MKTHMLRAAIATTIVILCQAALWAAGGTPFMMIGDEPRMAPSTGTAISSDQIIEGNAIPAGRCESCNEAGGAYCGLMEGCGGADCDECPKFGLVGLAGFESFRGVSDDDYQDNFGFVTGLNGAFPLVSAAGVGLQIGATYGMYDWDGRSSSNIEAQMQTQTFITTGIFRKASGGRRLSFGVVYDWMINTNWGVDATSPVLGQWRGQVEYALSNCNAVGFWGALRDHSHEQDIAFFEIPGVLTTRPIDQINFFWHHKFVHGADARVWFGCAENDRLDIDEGGSLGAWIFGMDIQVPISPRLALYANMQYMHPSAAAGDNAAIENSTDIGFGIMWYPGGNSKSRNLNGGCWMPYLPVANNSSFLVDQAATAFPQG